MIFNSTYTDPEKDLEVDKIIGKKFNLIESIIMGGIGSKRLILDSFSVKFEDYIKDGFDLNYVNIELRKKGIKVFITNRQNRITWVIPYYRLVIYKTPFFSIHCNGSFLKFSNKLNHKENLSFFRKLVKIKSNQF
ncbi:MAG: hypothetical protein CND26_02870 [Bacteroidetes bacterium MED-G13]|nr:MAG: hypothetical protein CND26_02870 [Bacteroidetes bacterium MED-G13]|tara:strand:+ start:8427 stop:8831 length:405 start_codon:yes stop_codon:yes gene_type:complete